jgi:hypothetical protein
MNKIDTKGNSGCSLYGLAVVALVLSVIALVVLVGLLLAAGTALIAFMTQAGSLSLAGGPAMGGWVGAALLATALLLLFIILVLLLVLLWCTCGGNTGQLKNLLKLLPLLKTLHDGLDGTAKALALMATALKEAERPVQLVGGAFHEAGDKVDVSLPIVTPHKEHFGLLHADVVTGFNTDHWRPFGEAKAKLQTAGDKFEGQADSLDKKLDEAATHCLAASEALQTIADVLAGL